MILRRYGTQIRSVEPDFDAHALNEIGFRRTAELVLTADEFNDDYTLRETHELTSETGGAVQDEAEQALLAQLLDALRRVEAAAADGVVVIESEPARDYPKTRCVTTTIVEAGDNRFRFRWKVDPPLRVGVYGPR